jgi:PST family polysaccharide transporter
MLSKFSNDIKRIIKNILSLAILQGINYLLPLIIVPYLLRTIGVEYFGLISFATAIIMYFVMFSDYGFNLSATQKIAIYRNNKREINEIVSSVLFIKLLIVLFSFVILIILLLIVQKLHEHYMLYIYTFGMVVGQAMIPIWLFQGMETMKYMTYFNIFAKGLATICIFLFVKEKADFIYVPMLTSFGYILAGILSLYYAIKIFDLKLFIPSKEKIFYYLKDGWHIFLNNIFVNLYSTTNTIILGFLTNNTIVGYYSIVQKIIGAISGLFVPITQAVYPHLAKLYFKQRENFYKFYKKIFTFIVVFSLNLIVIVFLFGKEIIYLISGNYNQEIYKILLIVSFLILSSPLGTLFTQLFLIFKRTDLFLQVVQYTFLINMILVFPLVYFYPLYGLAFTMLFAQIIHILLNIYFYNKVRKFICAE